MFCMVIFVFHSYLLAFPTVNFDNFHDKALLSLTFALALVLLYLQPI